MTDQPDPASEDALLGGRVSLRQPAEGYRAAIDPVLLAAAVPARTGEAVLDVGAGVGAAMLCLLHRVPGCSGVGIELQSDLLPLAEANLRDNGISDRARVVAGDIGQGPNGFLAAGVEASGFDHVLSNPPYLEAAASRPSPTESKAVSQTETTVDLAGWIDFCLAMLRPRGILTLIHRADRLGDLMAALAGRAGGRIVFPLWPKAGVSAKRVILQARKGAASPDRLAPGLVLHESGGRYTEAAEAVLRDAQPLEI